jgi:hypothetical protein
MGGGPYWSGLVSAKGVTRPQWGVANRWTVPEQLVAPGGGVGTHRGCQW